jgi:hypothetical protein
MVEASAISNGPPYRDLIDPGSMSEIALISTVIASELPVIRSD